MEMPISRDPGPLAAWFWDWASTCGRDNRDADPPSVGSKNGSVTVRMYFLSDDSAEDSNAFSVAIQGNESLKDFDVAKETDGNTQMIVKEFQGVLATQQLSVEFSSQKGKASVCGLEIVAE